MEEDSTCECIRKVMVMIPMPVSGLAEELARKLCNWRIPHNIVAVILIDMLLGTDRLEKVDQRIAQARTDIMSALTSGHSRVEQLEEAAKVLWTYNLDIWLDICRHLYKVGLSPSATEAQDLFKKFRSRESLDAAGAARFILDLRNGRTPGKGLEDGTRPLPRPGQ